MSFPPISDRQFALLAALSLAAGAAACAAPTDDDPSIVARYATSVGSELTFHDYGDGVAGVWHHGRLADGVPDEFPLTLVAPASIDTLYRQVFPDQVVPELFVATGTAARARDATRTEPGTLLGNPRSSSDPTPDDSEFPRGDFLPLCDGMDSADEYWIMTRRTGDSTKVRADVDRAHLTAATYRHTIRIILRYRIWSDWATQYDRLVPEGEYDGGGVSSAIFDFDADVRVEGPNDGWHSCGAFVY
jgi:hypothetical protein